LGGAGRKTACELVRWVLIQILCERPGKNIFETLHKYANARCRYVIIYAGVLPYPLIHYPLFTTAKKKRKIKEINFSYVSKGAPRENGP
jgi:hypothetical protein